MSFAAGDLDLVKNYFEAMFGCVVGCGCWKSGWDNAEQLARLLAADELDYAIEVLEAIERLQRDLQHSDMVAVGKHMEMHLPTVLDFNEFFGPSVDLLRDALAK